MAETYIDINQILDNINSAGAFIADLDSKLDNITLNSDNAIGISCILKDLYTKIYFSLGKLLNSADFSTL